MQRFSKQLKKKRDKIIMRSCFTVVVTVGHYPKRTK